MGIEKTDRELEERARRLKQHYRSRKVLATGTETDPTNCKENTDCFEVEAFTTNWTGSVVDGDDTVHDVSTNYTHHGSKSMRCYPNTGYAKSSFIKAYVYKTPLNFLGCTTYYFYFVTKWAYNEGSGTYFRLFEIKSSQGTLLLDIRERWTSAPDRRTFYIYYRKNGSATLVTKSNFFKYNDVVIVEGFLTLGASAGAVYVLFTNVTQETSTSVNDSGFENNDVGNIDYVQLGIESMQSRYNAYHLIYVDCWKGSSSSISADPCAS